MKKQKMILVAILLTWLGSDALFAEPAEEVQKPSVNEKMLKEMAHDEQSRRISELARSISNLERRMDRLDGRLERLDNDLKELKRKV
ncbi:MAG: hypothetical protein HY351_03400 [Candidatus Omnitrophica bacterium]|nr:hypothetical protein [Candidatus Omnitrophota bacterium]